LSFAGCGGSPTQVRRLEAENRRLGEETQAQLAEIQNLKVHKRKIEDELMAAESALDEIAARHGLDRRKLAALASEREKLRGFLADGSRVPAGVSGQLAELARRYPSIHFDPQTGIAKLDTDVLFDSGEAELKPGAQKLLANFGAILDSPAAQDLKIIVVGHTDNERIAGRETRRAYSDNWHLSAARSLAVAEKLRTAGVSGERMGIAGFSMHQPIVSNSEERDRQENRRVEIFVVSPDVPVVGMTETLTNLY
jgi:chemotaxis protein MotB